MEWFAPGQQLIYLVFVVAFVIEGPQIDGRLRKESVLFLLGWILRVAKPKQIKNLQVSYFKNVFNSDSLTYMHVFEL